MAGRGIEINQAQLSSVRELLRDIENGVVKAQTQAINKTLSTTKTSMRKRLGEKLNLKAARIDQDLSIDKASYDSVSGRVRAKGEPVGLINFAGKQLPKGVKVKVFKGGGLKLLKHAFIRKIKGRTESTDKEHLFWRLKSGWERQRNQAILSKKRYFIGKSSRFIGPVNNNEKNYRYKLHRLVGPRIEDILAKPEILGPIETEAADLFATNMDKAVQDLIRRNNL